MYGIRGEEILDLDADSPALLHNKRHYTTTF